MQNRPVDQGHTLDFSTERLCLMYFYAVNKEHDFIFITTNAFNLKAEKKKSKG